MHRRSYLIWPPAVLIVVDVHVTFFFFARHFSLLQVQEGGSIAAVLICSAPLYMAPNCLYIVVFFFLRENVLKVFLLLLFLCLVLVSWLSLSFVVVLFFYGVLALAAVSANYENGSHL